MTNHNENLMAQRQLIRPLLNEHQAADAMAAYFAFYHPDDKTQLVTAAAESGQAYAYMAVSRTSIDLFRPFVTMRLPIHNMAESVNFLYTHLQPGTAVFLNAPANYAPLLRAIFDISIEERLWLLELDPQRYKPIINVLVARSTSPNGYPRFIIRGSGQYQNEVIASAELNWQSPYFAEIAVHTHPSFQRRGYGRSVVSAMAGYLLENGRRPLYAVAEGNERSFKLADHVGFVDKGVRQIFMQGTLRQRP